MKINVFRLLLSTWMTDDECDQMRNGRVLSTFFGRLSLQRFMNEQISYEFFMCSEKPQGGGGYEVWTEKPVRYLNVYVFIYTSGYPLIASTN